MKKKLHLKKIHKIIIIVVLLITIFLLWSRYISTAGFEVREYKVISDKVPASFDGLKIVQLSDIHYNRTINEKKLESIVDDVNELKPDLIFFTGDLIDKDTKLTTKMENNIIKILSKLKSSYGKYAISGNHDMKFKQYNSIIQESGFTSLDNSYDIIYSANYESLLIAGLQTEVSGKPDLTNITNYLNDEKNKDSIPSYKILLLHTPDTYDKVKDYKFNLILAGHSHNGQVRLPFIGAIIKPVGAKKYYDQYYIIGDTKMYISGGLGTSTLNFRFFDKPSYNFYRLTNK